MRLVLYNQGWASYYVCHHSSLSGYIMSHAVRKWASLTWPLETSYSSTHGQQERIQGGGGAWGGHAPPSRPLRAEWASAKRGGFTLRLANVATPTQRTSLCESLFHVLQTWRIQICSSQRTILWQCVIYKGWFRREGRLSYRTVAIIFAWLRWSPTASEALSYSLNFLAEHAPTPTKNAVRYTQPCPQERGRYGYTGASETTRAARAACMAAPTRH